MITSSQNPKIRRVKALLQSKKGRNKEDSFVVEGVRLAEEAFNAGWLPGLILYSEALNIRGLSLIQEAERKGLEAIAVSEKVFKNISDTETPQGILMVFEPQPFQLPIMLDFVLILDQIRDPGNMGTLLRAANAAGVQLVIYTPGTTDPFAPKVLRAGMGAHFKMPVIQLSWEEIRSLADKNKPTPLHLLIADVSSGIPLWKMNFKEPTGIVIGSEAEGASQESIRYVAGKCIIPMPGKSESLNAAMAGTVILFEVVRQRFLGD